MRLWFHCDEERCGDEDSPRAGGSGFGLWLLLLRAFTREGIGAAGRGAEGGTHSVPGRLCQHKAPSTACPWESCSSPGLGLRKSSSFGEQLQSGLWAMGNAAVVAWAGVLQVWGRRSGAGGALAAVPSDGSHRLSSEGGFIVPLHRSIIMSLLSICGAKSWPSGAWSDQTSNNFPSHTRWENF